MWGDCEWCLLDIMIPIENLSYPWILDVLSLKTYAYVLHKKIIPRSWEADVASTIIARFLCAYTVRHDFICWASKNT